VTAESPMSQTNAGAPGFSWRAALLGGAASIGGSALLGTIITNVWLQLAIADGLSLQQAYARMAQSHASATALLSHGASFASAVVKASQLTRGEAGVEHVIDEGRTTGIRTAEAWCLTGRTTPH
jgi:hypothetical protein